MNRTLAGALREEPGNAAGMDAVADEVEEAIMLPRLQGRGRARKKRSG
jgi:hypothetical protein